MMGLDTFVTISFSIALPFLALYLHIERAVPMSLVGIIFFAGGLCTAATNMIGGMVSDRLGRRWLLLMFSSASIFAYATLALLTGMSASIWSIALVYIAARGTIGTIQPTIAAIVADLSPKTRLAQTYALVRVGGNVGFALGRLLYVCGYSTLGWVASFNWAILTIMIITAGEVTFSPIASAVDSALPISRYGAPFSCLSYSPLA